MSSWHYDFGSQRAHRERVPALEAIETLDEIAKRDGVDREAHAETAEAVYRSYPARFRDEIEGMVDALPAPRSSILRYMFRASDVVEEAIDDGDDEEGSADEGCTTAIVSAEASATGAPMLLKVRDVKAKGLQPQAIVERPTTEDHHGFVSLSTSMTPAVFQGVNDEGLAAANSFVDLADEDLDESEYVRNGVLIRRILEECASVEDATSLAESVPVERSKGLNLFVVDGEEAATIELDPDAAKARPIAGDVVVRSNHFPAREAAIYPSSRKRFERALEIVEGLDGEVAAADLLAFATDHRNGPGPDSICRHPSAASDSLAAQAESTTVSTCLFAGGERSFRGTFGNACEHPFLEVSLGANRPEALASGARWRATVGDDCVPTVTER